MHADTPTFSIDPEPGTRLLRIVLKGFWTEAAMNVYDAELRRVADAMEAAGCPRGEILALVDARDLNPQSQALIAAYKDRFSSPERQPRRLATIVSSALFKRQVERIGIPNQRIFETEAEGLAWLLR